MPDRVVQAGVTLRCETAEPVPGGPLEVSAEVWVEVECDGERFRTGGQTALGELVLGEDPTTPLIELALDQRETNLGDAFGDARIAGADVTRFEVYSAPFRVVLDEGLRAVLAGTWRERDPRF
jgi:hypothetical protein